MGGQKAPGYGGSCRVSELFTYRSTLKRESDNLSEGGEIGPATGMGLLSKSNKKEQGFYKVC